MHQKPLISCLYLSFVILSLSDKLVLASESLGKQWPASSHISISKINHTLFNKILKTYVDQDGYVDYKSLKANTNDRNILKEYLIHLSKANPRLKASRESRLAFWINTYNAVTLEGILQVYPTTSIRNHTAKLFGYNIWKDLFLTVGNRQYSLDQIENEILRKMNEPRIHFAIVCASVSCPRLLNEAYTKEKIELQLVKNSRDFFSREQNFRIDISRQTIYLSSILKWFGSDFGNSREEIFKTIEPYLPPKKKKSTLESNFQISYLSYNWNLNEQSNHSQRN